MKAVSGRLRGLGTRPHFPYTRRWQAGRGPHGRPAGIESPMLSRLRRPVTALITAALVWSHLDPALACTGISLRGADGAVIVGRTVEWALSDAQHNRLMIVPRGTIMRRLCWASLRAHSTVRPTMTAPSAPRSEMPVQASAGSRCDQTSAAVISAVTGRRRRLSIGDSIPAGLPCGPRPACQRLVYGKWGRVPRPRRRPETAFTRQTVETRAGNRPAWAPQASTGCSSGDCLRA